jgi:cytochrome c2
MTAGRGHRRASRLAAGFALLLLAGCTPDYGEYDAREAALLTDGGDARRGHDAIRRYGCGACHSIQGVNGARALVGPPLDGMAERAYIAGVIVNTPLNLQRWIRDPQGVDPRTAMPDLGVTDTEARDIAAYLYSLR